MNGPKILWIWVKSWFVCQHLPVDLVIDSRYEKVADDGEYEEWMCSCTCKCGESNIDQRFANSKKFLHKTEMESIY